MKKISLEKIYRARLKTKIIGVVLVLAVSFASFQLIIKFNPKHAKAQDYDISPGCGDYTNVGPVITIIGNSLSFSEDCGGGMVNQGGTLSADSVVSIFYSSGDQADLTISGNPSFGSLSIDGRINVQMTGTLTLNNSSGGLYIRGDNYSIPEVGPPRDYNEKQKFTSVTSAGGLNISGDADIEMDSFTSDTAGVSLSPSAVGTDIWTVPYRTSLVSIGSIKATSLDVGSGFGGTGVVVASVDISGAITVSRPNEQFDPFYDFNELGSGPILQSDLNSKILEPIQDLIVNESLKADSLTIDFAGLVTLNGGADIKGDINVLGQCAAPLSAEICRRRSPSLTLSGEVKAKNIYIKNGATVTHPRIGADYGDLDPISSVVPCDDTILTDKGKTRKVDITVQNDIVFENGYAGAGTIDVTGKGFPGGSLNIGGMQDGRGPGSSKGGVADTGGAGYGGKGEDGSGNSQWPTAGGSVYPPYTYDNDCNGSTPPISTPHIDEPYNLDPVYPGSGAGSSGADRAHGNSGGGVVNLTVGNQIKIDPAITTPVIIADGESGGYDTSPWMSGDDPLANSSSDPVILPRWTKTDAPVTNVFGSGSGGSVKITFRTPPTYKSVVDTFPNPFIIDKTHGANGGNSDNGTIYEYPNNPPLTPMRHTESTINPQISVRGGIGGTGAAGGGGRVAMIWPSYTTPPSVPNTSGSPTIQKILSSISRLGVAGAFNPYALQRGDVIKVTLITSGATGIYTLTDPWLKLEQGGTLPTYQCQPQARTFSGATAPTEIDNSLIWSGLMGDKTITYECKVD